MEWIDWHNHRIIIPPRSMKARRFHVVHLNETAHRHLLAIRTDRELVFPWPHHSKTFNTMLHRLESAAGIARKDHFGLINIRKNLATRLWASSPAAASFALGHGSQGVTLRHYVASEGLVAEALDELEQPEAFRIQESQCRAS